MIPGFCPGGFPHSEISGSTPVCGSPKLIAACHVLHRLFLPRHPPCALSSLTIEFTRTQMRDNLNHITSFQDLLSACVYFLVHFRRQKHKQITSLLTFCEYSKDTQQLTAAIQTSNPDTTRTQLAMLLSLVVIFTQSIQLSKIVEQPCRNPAASYFSRL